MILGQMLLVPMQSMGLIMTIDPDVTEQFLKGQKLNIAFISDIHLGHSRTPTEHIVRNLENAFPDNKETAKLDIIFINGDVFDSLQDFASTNALAIIRWIVKFLTMCAKLDIMVIVLEGTRLHDWKQSAIFVELNRINNIGCDLLYIDKIHVTYIKRFGIHVLFIPDESKPTAEETWQEVVRLMNELGIDKVDYACMHGAFPHQLPEIEEIKHRLHDPVKYQSIVRHYISIGHIHQFSILDKIIAQGSFDRLVHGDEGAKGHVRILKGVPKFIENKGAMRYKTLDVSGRTADIVVNDVHNYLAADTTHCSIRLQCTKEDVAFGMYRRLTQLYPYVRFEYINSSKSKKNNTVNIVNKPKLNLPKLTRENLKSEWLSEISARYPDRLASCEKIVESIIRDSSQKY